MFSFKNHNKPPDILLKAVLKFFRLHQALAQAGFSFTIAYVQGAGMVTTPGMDLWMERDSVFLCKSKAAW
jgi:hypothetical protein